MPAAACTMTAGSPRPFAAEEGGLLGLVTDELVLDLAEGLEQGLPSRSAAPPTPRRAVSSSRRLLSADAEGWWSAARERGGPGNGALHPSTCVWERRWLSLSREK